MSARVPTVLKMLRGNPGRRPLNVLEPVPGALSPACPKELTDDVARKEWRRTIAPAVRIGQITAADRVLAIVHCELWAAYRAQLLEASGRQVLAVGANAYPTPNVARGMSNTTVTLLIKVDIELGLTPVSRSKVQVNGAPRGRPAPAAPGAGALDRFLAGPGK